jgi:hypothetical protein
MAEPLSGEAPESGYYVYGVVPADAAMPGDLRGLDDSAVQLVPYAGIAAAVGHVVLDRPPGRRADLMAHSQVVDALAGATTVVPVQFGSVLAERTDIVDDLLQPNGEHFERLLAALEGTTQFILRATYLEEQVLAEVVRDDPAIAELHRRTRDLPPGTPHPDLVQLGERVSGALDAKRVEDGDVILEHVRPHVLDVVERPGGGVDHLLDVALLVDRLTTRQLEEALEVLAEGVHERIRLSLTGPLAPYDFVEGERWA